MTVRAPFRTTHWRQRRGGIARGGDPRRVVVAPRSPSARGRWPLPARSRANSPAWGVRTAGRRSPSHQSSIVASERSASASSRIGAWIGLVGDDQPSDELGRREAGPQPGPDDDRVVFVIEDPRVRRLRVELLDIVLRQGHRRRLDDLRREHRLEGLRHGQRHEAGPGPAGRPRHQEGCAGVVERARDDEELAERALMAACRALGEQRSRDRVIELGGTIRERCRVVGAARGGGTAIATTEPDRTLAGHQALDGSASRAAWVAAWRRSRRARIVRSRSSIRSSMSSGKTYRPPAVRTPKAIATA